MVKRKVQVYLGDASGGVVTWTEQEKEEVTAAAQSRVAGNRLSESELPTSSPNIPVVTDSAEVDGHGGEVARFFWTLLTQASYEAW